ncbi:pilus assembly protein TadG-related protein [Bradyrhizobium sp. NAS96.2]|uniref:pilus assembly protein TadG-related protein n=1 Tax=Bradyrhizobium sp. NAS96.2 TaxID=1680160 RepID=UPI00093FF510|nr:pilus assembly protein TadG-related protein [Bradyrhizobium sp. NAS96.2]
MRNMLHCRQGSVAFATVVALVPLIGMMALGAEAGSWYVIKQRAQNAADAAAYSGALRLACSLGSLTCADTQSMDYRGKEFAAQNTFCNSGDTSYPGSTCAASLPSGVSQTVTIALLTSWKGSAGNFVQANVSQQQGAYLAAVLGLTSVNIGATAVAQVQNPKNLCALGLGRWPNNSALTIGGNVTNSGNGCGLMSNDTVKYSSTPAFTGTGWAVDAAKGCLPNATQCGSPGVPYNYFMPTAKNPLSGLDSASFNSATGKTSKPPCSGTLSPNTPTSLYGDLTCTTGNTVTLQAGTYFFYNAAIKLNGGTISGTGVTLVLLGDSSISISGSASVNLSAPSSNSTYPALAGVLIDDQAPNKSNNAVTVNGNGTTVNLGGAMYFPNVDVTWSGTSANANTTCSEVIANTLTMTGSAYLNTTGCAPGTVAQTQVVLLVP